MIPISMLLMSLILWEMPTLNRLILLDTLLALGFLLQRIPSIPWLIPLPLLHLHLHLLQKILSLCQLVLHLLHLETLLLWRIQTVTQMIPSALLFQSIPLRFLHLRNLPILSQRMTTWTCLQI